MLSVDFLTEGFLSEFYCNANSGLRSIWNLGVRSYSKLAPKFELFKKMYRFLMFDLFSYILRKLPCKQKFAVKVT